VTDSALRALEVPGLVSSILPAAARAHGPKPALVTADRTLTFAELDELSARVAAGLHARGVQGSDVVSLYSPNRWEWIVAYHGILRAGAVVNPINVMLTPSEVAFVMNDCGARRIFTSAEKATALAELGSTVETLDEVISFEPGDGATSFDDLLASSDPPPDVGEVTPSASSTIGYTSGTTGHPKGAVQTHRAVFLNCALTATMHGRTADDVVVTALPAPHVYGNVVINGTFMSGGTVVLMERFDAAGALELLERHAATMFEGVPAMYAMMLAEAGVEDVDLSSLTRSTVGGQTIPIPAMEQWEERSGAPLIELWGMTELSGLGTTHAVYAPNVHGSIGVPLPGVEARVASFDDAAGTAPVGEQGELMIRGPIAMTGYFGNDEATAAAIEADGWLHTGDVAYSDEHGYLFVVDRLKDMIITGGYNIYPAEIERVVASHPAVAMVAVGRVPDEVKGELARAYVVLRAGATATEAELIEHCRGQLAAYKLPRSVRFVDDLPKTSSGKIMRRELATLDVD
jgi:long-chain acyl-CoA synthetase